MLKTSVRQLGPEVLFVELTDRKKQILKVVVEDYVRTAEPVGSKAIAAEMGGVSSATIRNELSDLTELGYLEQPHTSAGQPVPPDADGGAGPGDLPGGPSGEFPDELPRLCGRHRQEADDRPAV